MHLSGIQKLLLIFFVCLVLRNQSATLDFLVWARTHGQKGTQICDTLAKKNAPT